MVKKSTANNNDTTPHVSGQANKPLSKPAHSLSFDEAAKELQANVQDGLTVKEAEARLLEYGKNELDNGPGVQPFKILIRQIANAMMLVSLAMVSRLFFSLSFWVKNVLPFLFANLKLKSNRS